MQSLLPIKMKNKKPIVGKVIKSNRKIEETVAESIPLKHIHNRLFSELGTGTSVKTWRGFARFMGPNLSSY